MKVVLRASALVALGTGSSVMAVGTKAIPDGGPVSPTVDNVLRFYAAWWAGAGLLMWRIAPDTKNHDGLLKALLGVNFVGGLVRLLASRQNGRPHRLFRVIAIEELILSPAALTLQGRITRR
jgi:hypothetical protein